MSEQPKIDQSISSLTDHKSALTGFLLRQMKNVTWNQRSRAIPSQGFHSWIFHHTPIHINKQVPHDNFWQERSGQASFAKKTCVHSGLEKSLYACINRGLSSSLHWTDSLLAVRGKAVKA